MAALDEVGVDSLLAEHARDLIDGLEHRALQGAEARVAAAPFIDARGPEKNPETQPPFRPEAPKPETSRSRITTRNDGSACLR